MYSVRQGNLTCLSCRYFRNRQVTLPDSVHHQLHIPQCVTGVSQPLSRYHFRMKRLWKREFYTTFGITAHLLVFIVLTTVVSVGNSTLSPDYYRISSTVSLNGNKLNAAHVINLLP
jgi:hypothetical protein